MARILAVADEIAHSLTPMRVRSMRPDLVIGCGDLPWSYLETIASSTDAPLVFVPGNHDPRIPSAKQLRNGVFVLDGRVVDAPRPHGGTNLDLQVLDVAGLRLAGIGGCVRYRPGPHQYSQREYQRRAGKLVRQYNKLNRRSPGRLDLLISHAPPRGVGDEEDRPHQGVEALHTVIADLRPRLHLHGHIHPFGRNLLDRVVDGTTIRNVVPFKLFELNPIAREGPDGIA